MSEEKAFQFEQLENSAAAMDVVGKLFDITKPDAIFSQPLTSGDYTVITASELWVTMGAGYGSGEGYSEDGEGGSGGGGGGGGTSLGRPVAAITIGPNGVSVEPIVDPTKITIAFFTTLGTMLLLLIKMAQKAR